METNIEMCADKICRTCLCEKENMKSLFNKIDDERSFSDIIRMVANINILMDDKLPKQVCPDCELIICKVNEFRRRCYESETYLYKVYGSPKQNINKDDVKKKSLVKNEKMLEIDTSRVYDAKNIDVSPIFELQCSVCFYRCSNQVDLQKHMTDKHGETKAMLFGISVEVPHKGLEAAASGELEAHANQLVKEEMPFEMQTNDSEDFSFDNFVADAETVDEVKPELKLHTCSCGTLFVFKKEYDTHIKTCKNTKGHPCPKCAQNFTSTKKLAQHMKTHKDKTKLYQCSMCMRKFVRKSALSEHIKRHELKDGVKFPCDICKREFQYRAHLNNHMLQVHQHNKGFACDYCTRIFATQSGLTIHKDTHHISQSESSKEPQLKKYHHCKFCNKSFNMVSTLKDHLRTHTGEKPYLCSTCGRGFSQKTNLAQHMRRHQGLKPFQCNSCDRSFVSKGELQAHARKHSGAHPFVCDACGSAFTTSSSLVKHRRTHTGERPYACDLCPMRFAASGTLANHRRTHTGERPFQCSYCEKAFVQKQDLVSHIRCHTGERPYVCCTCRQAFRKSSALKVHLKMHLKDQRDNFNVLQGVNTLLNLQD